MHKLVQAYSQRYGIPFETLIPLMDLLVVSPGIRIEHPAIERAKALGVEVVGEIEYAYRESTGLLLALTGTNGKTTTTALLEHVLLSAGKTAKACGNYGYPLSEVALMEPQPEFAVLEVSSFQMETIIDFKPEVAIWLNFAPDHMDRYTKVEYDPVAEMREIADIFIK